VSAGIALCLCLQQCLGLPEIRGVKAFGESPIDRRQQHMRFSPLAVLLPQSGQAHGRPQLPGFGLLATCNGQGLLEAGFGAGRVWDALPQQELALEPIRLRAHITPPAGLECRQRLDQQAQSFPDLASVPAASVSWTEPKPAAGSQLMESSAAR
jgi:hypothetical protein